MPKIAVITHPSDNFAGWMYLLKPLLRQWGERGIETVIVTRLEEYTPADVAFVHVDLTVVPPETVALIQRYPNAINGKALDTRKSAYSSLLVSENSEYVGSVMVKTDRNCGGWREFRNDVSASLIGRITRRLRGFETYYRLCARREVGRPWDRRRLLVPAKYPVLKSVADVPKGVWKNSNLVVEKFLSERDGAQYCVRYWEFLGSQEVTFLLRSDRPVVKYSGHLEKLSEPVPSQLREVRKALHLDYGKIDYGMVDGEARIYDVNRTTGNADDEGPLEELFDCVREGIRDFLPPAQFPAAGLPRTRSV